MRILFILILLFYTNIAHSEKVNWKFKERIKHDTYYEAIAEGKKIINVDGKEKKVKLINKHIYPLNTKMNNKEGRCKDWQIEEITHKGKYIRRSYFMNDCLPCIDAGSGYMCSYPYFGVVFDTEIYRDYYWNEKNNVILKQLKDDGTIEITIFANMGSREKLFLSKEIWNLSSLGLTGPEGKNRYTSEIIKFNTRLRKIESETTKPKVAKKMKYKLVFDRIADKVYELLSNPGELKIREKDLKILFSIEPSASIIKYQTRD